MIISIVGGTGGMGKFFGEVFHKHGATVHAIGRETKNPQQLIAQSGAVFFSVPSIALKEVLKDYTEEGLEGKLVGSFASNMTQANVLLKSKSKNIVFIHPLFGPDITNLTHQHIVIAGNTDDERTVFFKKIFAKEKAEVFISTIKEHDEMMAYVQALSQFSSISLARTLSQSGIAKQQLMDFSSLTFRLNAEVISRIMMQDANLWSTIQFESPLFKKILDAHIKSIQELRKLVVVKDYAGFAKMFTPIVAFWKEEKTSDFVAVPQGLPKKNLKKSIGVLGPVGTYSHEASRQAYPDLAPQFFDSINEVLKSLSEDKIEIAIVPFENSIEGTVLETLDNLYYKNLKIVSDTVLDIRHCIAGLDKRIEASHVKTIYSHPQALAQCKPYIQKNYGHAKLVVTPSTAAACKKIKDEGLIDTLAISSRLAAETNGLQIIDTNIQETKNNQTLFVTVSKKSSATLSYVLLGVLPQKDRPGLLYDILSTFKKKKINLSKIESRPSKEKLGAYIFYVKAQVQARDSKFKEIMKELKELKCNVKILS